jgi:hypothetical protein
MRSQGLDGKHNVEASSGNTIVVAKKTTCEALSQDQVLADWTW